MIHDYENKAALINTNNIASMAPPKVTKIIEPLKYSLIRR
ncbi:uncharacterized protein METZ01_LOCUS386080 [marine metagenome]|uniref:Uncharacterized protein n=1 Tax=marine metagenome TaxID=408172 RepID=A0A382UG36_9ZZZZ